MLQPFETIKNVIEKMFKNFSGRITPEPSPVSDKAEDTRIYFSMIQSSWNE